MNRIAWDRMPSSRETAPTAVAGPYPMGLMAVLATVGMLFAAFTAALLVRRTGTDWTPVVFPTVVWGNSLVLILSSAAVETARTAVRRSGGGAAVRWLGAATVLGVLFLVGQAVAWGGLAARGVFLPTNPHASFFYMLSAVHGAHVIGGVAALVWTLHRTAAGAYTARRHEGLTHVAVYWHFVGVIWIYLLVLLTTL